MSRPGGALPPEATERVLPTLNVDGSRRWLTPRESRGRFHARRRAVAAGLILLFTALPYLRIHGKPAILLDVVGRRFTLLGPTFYPTETGLLMLLLVGLFLAVFLATAVLGRVWCGWACPQTVYMEFLFRPLERLFQGGLGARPRVGGPPWARSLLRHAVLLAVSMFLAHTFLAYFVGVEALALWVRRSPVEHPIAFLVMAGTTALMFVDFGHLREQVCLVACPYGRFQSVLLDRRSLIVGYDARRGEPRAKPGRPGTRNGAAPSAGDCIDCGACVATCPTGIDIRDGLQMECIHCTQCIDACDAIMDRIGRPRGLVRYTSRDELAGAPRRVLRPRIVVYPALLLLAWSGLGWALARRTPADVTVLRGIGSPFAVLPSGQVSNQIRVKIENRGDHAARYQIDVPDAPDLRLVTPENPVTVPAGRQATASVFVVAPAGTFASGERPVRVRVWDGAGFEVTVPYRLLGPSR